MIFKCSIYLSVLPNSNSQFLPNLSLNLDKPSMILSHKIIVTPVHRLVEKYMSVGRDSYILRHL